MANEKYYIKFYPRVWMNDVELRNCSLAARGLLIDIMALAFDGQPYGYLSGVGGAWSVSALSKTLACNWQTLTKHLAELEQWGRLRRTDEGVIFVPRMIRDKLQTQQAQEFGRRGGNPKITSRVNPPLNPNKAQGDNPPLNPEYSIVKNSIEEKNPLTPPLFQEGDNPVQNPADLNMEVVREAWNIFATQMTEAGTKVAKAVTISGERKRALHSRLKDTWWREHWQDALLKLPEIVRCRSWMRGGGNRNWTVGFTWFVRPDTVTKIIEDSYPGKKEGQFTRIDEGVLF